MSHNFLIASEQNFLFVGRDLFSTDTLLIKIPFFPAALTSSTHNNQFMPSVIQFRFLLQ